MPHEHINSSFVPLLPDGRSPERVVVSWTKPNHVIPGRDGRPEPGSVQLSSEWLTSEARWPSPRLIEIDPNEPHAFNAADDSNECRWCDRTQTDGPHGIIDPTKTHLFRGDPDGHVDGSTRCVHCGQTYAVGPHASATAERDVALSSSDDSPQHRFVATATFDIDPDSDTCRLCGKTKRDGNHDGHKTGPRKVFTEGEPTWSEPCTGFNVTLSREDINYLIGRLRRARDEAFGGDA